jgi:hypothetical protein
MAFNLDAWFKEVADRVGRGEVDAATATQQFGDTMTNTTLPDMTPDAGGGGYANRRPGQTYIDQITHGWRGAGAMDPLSINRRLYGKDAYHDVMDWYTSGPGKGLHDAARQRYQSTLPDPSPVAQPAAPVAQPAAPVAQPAAPVAQPAAPVAQPAAPVAQPAAPVAQPAAPPADPLGNAAATGQPAPADYKGDVFEYAPPENPLLPQVQQIQQQLIDLMLGRSTPPEMEAIMTGLRNRQAQQEDELRAQLAMRGVANSTPGAAELGRLLENQRAEQARTRMGITGQMMQNQLPALQQIYGQGVTGREQSMRDFLNMYDRQFRSDSYQDARRQQAVNSMLQALGMNMPPVQMPNVGIPAAQPGFVQSLSNLFGNAMMTPGFSSTPMGQWLS